MLGILTGCGKSHAPADKVNLTQQAWTLSAPLRPEIAPWPATVPGTVMADLVNAGTAPDPYLGTHELDNQWVEDEAWVYQTWIERPPTWGERDSAVLSFEHLDTYATIKLNGQPVLETNNAHRTWITPPFALQDAPLSLTVEFDPVAWRGQQLLDSSSYSIPASNESKSIGFQTSPFTRKPGYQFGWDWGPRLAGPGIAGEVWLKPWGKDVIERSPQCRVLAVDESQAIVLVESASEWTLDISFRGQSADISWDGDTLVVRDPQLWWPAHMGGQGLYDMVWTHRRSGLVRAERMGLRTAEWIQEADSMGKSFQLEINGTPVFARGANVVPPDFLSPYDAQGWEAIVEKARETNMNMLRVWGGGVYPPDSFYDSCDEAGIMVWQDFMFACTMVPTDEAFVDNVRLEAREQAMRLRHHPSLVLWCGNNEIEKAWQAWGWQGMYNLHGADSAAVFDAYRHVFHDVLPTEVTQVGQTAYLPSSPTLDVASGDVHAWGIWFGKEPFDYYSRHEGRFASEYGLQSLPNLLTLQEAGIQGFHDEALQFRQRCQMDWLEPGFDGWDMMSHYMSTTTGSPRQGDLEDWIVKSQITQAEGIRQALERHRTSHGRYAGSLYWSLNDVWPAVSWSTVDHAGRKKLGHHAAKRANAPRTLLWKRGETDRFQLVAFNDSASMWVDTVTVRLCAMDGAVLRKVSTPLALSGRSQSTLDLGEGWTDDPENTFWCWTASDRIGSGLWDIPIGVNLGQANITMSRSGQTLTLKTDRYVPYACLVSDADLRFEDNGFALIPGEAKDVEIQAVPGNPTIRVIALGDRQLPQ